MYKGYNLSLGYEDEDDYLIGLIEKGKQEKIIQARLAEFLSVTGEIDGSKLESEWFPQVEAEVFISHSHKDKELAVTLAGWLKANFGLKSFIDSTVWGYSDNLLRNIDKEYCYNNEKNTYDYSKRNLSTSHVHMLLSAALAKIMNSCECLFFLNTPNSIKPESAIHESETYSPWLYYEIAISSLIQKPLREHPHRKKLIKGTKIFTRIDESEKELLVRYKLGIDHLQKIDTTDLNKWCKRYNEDLPRAEFALDKLYGFV